MKVTLGIIMLLMKFNVNGDDPLQYRKLVVHKKLLSFPLLIHYYIYIVLNIVLF